MLQNPYHCFSHYQRASSGLDGASEQDSKYIYYFIKYTTCRDTETNMLVSCAKLCKITIVCRDVWIPFDYRYLKSSTNRKTFLFYIDTYTYIDNIDKWYIFL